jgi:ferredoxin-thioredoxin reductase catalytic subunit
MTCRCASETRVGPLAWQRVKSDRDYGILTCPCRLNTGTSCVHDSPHRPISFCATTRLLEHSHDCARLLRNICGPKSFG